MHKISIIVHSKVKSLYQMYELVNNESYTVEVRKFIYSTQTYF